MNKKTRKKILFFLPKGVGGAQKMTILISQFLPTDIYDIKYIIVGRKKDNDMSDLINPSLSKSYLNIKNIWDFLTLRLIKKMMTEKPDIVFSSIMYLNVRVIFAAKLIGGIKVIVRNDNMLSTQRWDKLQLLKIAYPLADIIIAQQEEMKYDLVNTLSLENFKVVVKYNPVNTELIYKLSNTESPFPDNQTLNYVWTGNFIPSGSKGQDILVKAFKIVHEQIPQAHLYILGVYFENDFFFKYISKFVHTHNMSDSVHFIGFQNNPYPWIKYASCFVLPSRVEGLPNALVDAMVLEKPIVATTCIPIISRMIKNGYNGYLVPPEDYKAMADAMIKALALKNFHMTYKPSRAEDFIQLFN